MTRLLHGFTCLAGLCAITLVLGCGSSSKKVTCDGSGCTDAKKDVGGDTKVPDGGTTTDARPDTVVIDGASVTPDTPIGDTLVVNPDTRIGDTVIIPADTRPDVNVVIDTRPDVVTDLVVIPDTQRDTTPGDTARDTVPADTGLDTPVLLDAAPDTAIDAPMVDAPVTEVGEEPGDAQDDSEGDDAT